MSNLAPDHVFIKRLDWSITTVELFSYFSSEPWSILLDSANAEHCDANFDIICASPIATLTTKNASTLIERPSALRAANQSKPAKQLSSDDPLTLLAELQSELYPVNKVATVPFSGGAMGSFSYDLGRHFECLPTLAQADIDLPDMCIGFYDWALIFDYDAQSWSLVHYVSQAALEQQLAQLQGILAATLPEKTQTSMRPFSLTSAWQNQLSQEEYKSKFDTIQAYLHSGDCYQINLTQRFSAPYQGDEWQAYLALRKTNSAPFSAFMRVAQHCIISISPERFIQLNDREVQTKPIKGTMPRFTDTHADKASALQLMHSEKDRAENVMIVDLLRNDIGKVASAGSVTVPHLFAIESFPAVHHLVSTVTARLAPEYQPTDLLRAAFPGGSITGAPKIRAMEIIEELEPSRRSLYCGSMGYLSQNGNMDTSITIRTLITQNNQIYCWAGGGIVADSHVEAEYQESFDKVSKILPVLSQLNKH